MNELDMHRETEYTAKLNKVQNYDTKEWSFFSSIKVRNSVVQEYKDKGKLEELQDELIKAITKEVKEKLVWLQLILHIGYKAFFEISDSNTLSTEQVKMIRAHLNLVFFHAIDPETLKDKSDIEKLKYQKIHDGAKSGDTISQKEFEELIRKSKPTESRSSIILQDDEPKSFFYDDSKITYNC